MQLILKFGKSLIAGGVGALTNLAVLFVLHGLADVWYLLASVVAFSSGVLANFLLQKVWVFVMHDTDRLTTEVAMFFLLGGLNLLLNTTGMYLLVSFLGMHYLVAQFLLAGSLAVLNFSLYGKIFGRT